MPKEQNNDNNSIIFQAEVVEKDGKKTVAFIYRTKHIPTLDHIVQQLSYDIIELRALEKAKQEMKKSIIHSAGGGIINFIRGKKG